ncbi:fatty acyl-CoA reductase 2-like [Senna tora]|uniref:Fatty acyl-CoA reductase n=1 Tax=Senna tora TaxID=362788 RepID=A0A834X0W6_9FABA|nr:fatty acyl-CoA reductase 2-like [Senna tora]
MFKPLSLYNSSEYAYTYSSIPQIIHHHHAFTKTSRNSNDIPYRCHFNKYFCNIRDPHVTQKFNNDYTVHYQARESESSEWETPQRNLKDGIGISRFLQGKNFLIIGATGFVAKVLIEKILRTSPEVGQIFLLVKAKDKEAALNRLKTEVKEVHGEKYEEFMMKKLVAIPGNICESDLGIDPLTANHIANNVHVIVNSAATTNFDERSQHLNIFKI